MCGVCGVAPEFHKVLIFFLKFYVLFVFHCIPTANGAPNTVELSTALGVHTFSGI